MSKHFRGMDGSLLKANKSWSDLSNKQKDKIAGWMKDAFQKHHPDDEAVLDEVFQKIDECGIWIPDYEIIKRYNSKKGKYQKDLEAKKSEVNTLKRYNIIMVFSADNSRILKESITPLYHLMDLTYYHVNSLIECYMCRLTEEVELIQETGGNELEWISIEGTDFGNTEIFAGDGNILHCFLIAQHYMASKK